MELLNINYNTRHIEFTTYRAPALTQESIA